MTFKDMEDCTACPDAELAERAVLYLAQRSADVTGSSWVSSRGILMVWFHLLLIHVHPSSQKVIKCCNVSIRFNMFHCFCFVLNFFQISKLSRGAPSVAHFHRLRVALALEVHE
jgi:hypothetical protein